jgi:hypothetical protein
LVRAGLSLVAFSVGLSTRGMRGLRATARTFASREALERAAKRKATEWTRQGFTKATLTAGQKTLFLAQARRRSSS